MSMRLRYACTICPSKPGLHFTKCLCANVVLAWFVPVSQGRIPKNKYIYAIVVRARFVPVNQGGIRQNVCANAMLVGFVSN